MPAGSSDLSIAIDGPTRMATPNIPTPIPTVASGSRSWTKTRLKIATQAGIGAISNAAMPDGRSARPTRRRPCRRP